MTHTTNEKAPGATNTEGLDTDSTNDLNFATGQRPRKELATLIAQLAMAGHAVHRGNCNDFTVCKYGFAQYCQDAESLQAFARKLGVCK